MGGQVNSGGDSNTGGSYLLIPALLLAVCLAYLNSFQGSFQFDDYDVIINSPVIQSWSAWAANLDKGIRPMLKFTYALNWTTGLGIFGFHFFNLLIHLSNSVMVYFLTRLFLQRHVGSGSSVDAGKAALAAALVFGLHPVQTEAVTYISGRSTSLMAFFYLGSVLAYCTGKERRDFLRLHVVSPLLFIMAVATKEVALTLPIALLLWEMPRSRADWLGAMRKQLVHWLLLLTLFMTILFNQRYAGLLMYSFTTRTLHDNLLSQINAVTYLVTRLADFRQLNIDPDLPVLSRWTPTLIAQGTYLAVIIAWGIREIRKNRAWRGIAILWFFLHLLPTNSFIPRTDIANERQLYLPLAGLCMLLGMELYRSVLFRRTSFSWVVTGAVVLLGGFTMLRNHEYRSEISLWEATALRSPHKPRVFNNLGYAYENAGRAEEAIRSYRTALQLNPAYSRARNNLVRVEARRDAHEMNAVRNGGGQPADASLAAHGIRQQ